MTKEDFDLYFGNDLSVLIFEYEGKEGYVSKNYDNEKEATVYVMVFDDNEVLEYDENKITKVPFVNGKSLEEVREKLIHILG